MKKIADTFTACCSTLRGLQDIVNLKLNQGYELKSDVKHSGNVFPYSFYQLLVKYDYSSYTYDDILPALTKKMHPEYVLVFCDKLKEMSTKNISNISFEDPVIIYNKIIDAENKFKKLLNNGELKLNQSMLILKIEKLCMTEAKFTILDN